MKQHIDLTDLLDLSPDQQLKLISYLPVPNEFMDFKSKKWSRQLSREINIGKMIEILRSKLFKIEIYNFDSKWRVIFWHAGPRKEFVADELADALFQAIKAVL